MTKRSAVNNEGNGNGEEEEATGKKTEMTEKEQGMETESRREKKKRKKLSLKMQVLQETADRMSPILGYFPSGYDPVATGADPEVKVFRNKKKPNRLELVVRPGESSVEFVGKSYTGEAALPQLSMYTVGILDKETQTLKIMPIAANKILRLEPRVVNAFGERPEVGDESIIDGGKQEHKMLDLANLYGTKKFKNMLNKLDSIRQKEKNTSALKPLKVKTDENLNDGASDDIKEQVVRNIPPYDSSAEKPADAYPLHMIIQKEEWGYLNDILETLKSVPLDVAQDAKFWENNHYPSFVIQRLRKLRNMKDEAEKTRLACILSYITHLINFRKVAGAARWKGDPNYTVAMSEYKIPPIVFNRFLMIFLDPSSNMFSSEKNELLIGYILVLTLFADNFNTDTTDIEQDLAMTATSLRPYFLQLGCTSLKVRNFSKHHMTLPVPLVFKELKKKYRQRSNRY